jgi:hypothetical protein
MIPARLPGCLVIRGRARCQMNFARFSREDMGTHMLIVLHLGVLAGLLV